MNLKSKILIVVLVPVLFQIFVLLELGLLLKEAEKALKLQVITSDIQSLSNHLQKDLNTAMSLAFMYRLTDKPELGARLDATLKTIPPVMQQFQALLNDAGYNQKSQSELVALITEALQTGESIRKVDPTNGSIAERKRFTKFGAERLQTMTEKFADVDAFAIGLNSNPRAAIQGRQRVVVFLFVAAGADVLLAIVLGTFTMVSIVNRIAVVKENTRNLALEQALQPEVGGHDEITELDRYFRTMAISLEDSNKRQRALIENAVDVLCSIDRNETFVSVSRAAQKIWGYEPDALLGKNVLQLIAVQDTTKAAQFLKDAIDSKVEKKFETIVIKADGAQVEMRWSTVWSDKDQNLFAVVRDVSRENELARMKQALVDTAAHELRAPLTAIVATLNNLALGVLGELTPRAQTKVEKIESQAKRLVRLVSDLLDDEKLSTGQMGFSKAPMIFTPVIDEAISILTPLADKKAIKIVVNPLPEIKVYADKDRILQVVINILGNAIKFSPPSSIVKIEVKSNDLDLRVEITDQGPGISDERKAVVFERFNQVGDKNRTEAGSGLGLSIAKSIIVNHGGTIGVRDEVSGGSLFWFTLAQAEP